VSARSRLVVTEATVDDAAADRARQVRAGLVLERAAGRSKRPPVP
jgi:hypothetical protein